MTRRNRQFLTIRKRKEKKRIKTVMGLYKKKLVTRDGDKKIRRDSHFDTGKYRVGDKVKHVNGDVGTILYMLPIGKHFLIEFSDLDYGATDLDLVGHAHEG